MLPVPFTKIVFLWGEPIFVQHVKDEKETEEMRLYLENVLLKLSEEAERIVCGK
ncbi:MAG TPA: hypothetical protein PLW88_03970 [Syntrophorhabdaceae bacterium]|mgnify:CR=1 FL=1|nr:hypothetical protein [Syntrophorhabdaceae bacterium]HPP06502.1 hypothetical protein [Syntrophorhabdaceae bacterium]